MRTIRLLAATSLAAIALAAYSGGSRRSPRRSREAGLGPASHTGPHLGSLVGPRRNR